MQAQPQSYGLGYSNLAAASRWNTTRPQRLAAVPAVPPFQLLPSSISRVATVGAAPQVAAMPPALPAVSGATVMAVPVRAPAAFKNALQVATSNFQVLIV